MLIPLPDVIARYGLTLHKCLHVGAHEAQEAACYVACGIDEVAWVEGNPATIPLLQANVATYGHRVIEAIVSATTGEPVTFHVAEADNYSNHGQSSSILPLGTHKEKHPEVSYVADIDAVAVSLDDLCGLHEVGGPGWDLLSLDVQGNEGAVLAGAERMLEYVTMVYWEANQDELYQGCMLFPEVDAFLVDHGFETVEVLNAGCQRRDCSDGGNRWVGWADAVSLRTPDPRPFSETHPDQFNGWYVPERGRAAQRRDRARARRR